MQCSIAASPRLPVRALGEIATLLISKVAFNDESGAFRAGTPKLLVGREAKWPQLSHMYQPFASFRGFINLNCLPEGRDSEAKSVGPRHFLLAFPGVRRSRIGQLGTCGVYSIPNFDRLLDGLANTALLPRVTIGR